MPGELVEFAQCLRPCDSSRDLALIEAGLMTQSLELAATAAGIGLCHVGDLQFFQVRAAFSLAPDDILLHGLIVGLLLT